MAIFSLSFTGEASLFEADSAQFGTGSLTVDTRTGLTWLDLSFSRNLSYLQAEAATQPGGMLAGFRHASCEEVIALYTSAGFGEGFTVETSVDFQSVASLISLTGGNGASEAIGITGTLRAPGGAVVAGMVNSFVNGEPGYWVTATTAPLVYGLDTQFPEVGNWMVVVPEPSTMALLTSATAIIILRRRLHG